MVRISVRGRLNKIEILTALFRGWNATLAVEEVARDGQLGIIKWLNTNIGWASTVEILQ
jgi:hypothetical protein